MNHKDHLATLKDKAINNKHLRRNMHVSAVPVVPDKKATANRPSPNYDSFKTAHINNTRNKQRPLGGLK